MAKRNRRGRQASGSPETIQRRREEKTARSRARRRRRGLIAALVLVAVVAAGGSALYALTGRSSDEYDLSVVGRGVPAVVQVHDVTCPVCTELRAQIETIADEFEEDELLIRVADIRDSDAVNFVAPYTTARRATLLYIAADGSLTRTASGAHTIADLRQAFQEHSGRRVAD